MSLANTGGAGRGSQEGEVVGSVILHGKKHLWGQPNRHYHEGLRSGDNTLNLLCVRVLLRSMTKTGRYDAGDFLREYIAFMTTPDSHRDTYAESYHRAFFANFARGVAPERCAGAEGHDTASIGGLVGLAPVIMAALREDDAAAVDRTLLAHLRLTHRSAKLGLSETSTRNFKHQARELASALARGIDGKIDDAGLRNGISSRGFTACLQGNGACLESTG